MSLWASMALQWQKPADSLVPHTVHASLPRDSEEPTCNVILPDYFTVMQIKKKTQAVGSVSWNEFERNCLMLWIRTPKFFLKEVISTNKKSQQ